MCEANAYLIKGEKEELLMESVDVIEPDKNGGFRLIGIFGNQTIVKGNIKRINLVDHKILFESEIEKIEIKHSSKSREGLAKGAILAAEFMLNKKGAYTMNDLLQF